jgi:hypothetical protein
VTERSEVVLAGDNVMYGDDYAYEIVTPTATYYYHKQGAGFAGMVDRDGRDWISHSKAKGSAGEYRGIPNVGPAGFHPGSSLCTSRVEQSGEGKLTIVSERTDKSWACAWDIFATHATLSIVKTNGEKYYFLYEGTPNGRFSAETNYLVRPDLPGRHMLSSATDDSDIVPDTGETYEWIYFSDTATERVLFLVHHEDDDRGDRFWPMEENMTVFGFGRTGGNDMHLTACPQHFTIGFCETAQRAAVQHHIRTIMDR